MSSKNPLAYMHFLPRSCIDPANREVDRALRLVKVGSAFDAEFITFAIPSKQDFPDWLYVDQPDTKPTMTFKEYASGANKEPNFAPHISVSQQPESMSAKEFEEKKASEGLKVVAKQEAPKIEKKESKPKLGSGITGLSVEE